VKVEYPPSDQLANNRHLMLCPEKANLMVEIEDSAKFFEAILRQHVSAVLTGDLSLLPSRADIRTAREHLEHDKRALQKHITEHDCDAKASNQADCLLRVNHPPMPYNIAWVLPQVSTMPLAVRREPLRNLLIRRSHHTDQDQEPEIQPR
jgi:hypothetical protein